MPVPIDLMIRASQRLRQCNLTTSDQQIVLKILKEWYSNKSLNSALIMWQITNSIESNKVQKHLKILSGNVQRRDIRTFEAIELECKMEASMILLAEMGKL